MKRLHKLTFDEVIAEWLKAEWYKSHFDSFREELKQVVTNPKLNSSKENKIRKDLLVSLRYDFVSPLYALSCKWYSLVISRRSEYENLFIIPASDWYRESGKTFRLGDVPQNLHYKSGHRDDIDKKVTFLQSHERFNERVILIGSSEDDLTIIEGNHRMIAILLYMQKHNLDNFPQKVIAGFTPNIAQYRWSKKWQYMKDFLDLRKKEEISFNL